MFVRLFPPSTPAFSFGGFGSAQPPKEKSSDQPPKEKSSAQVGARGGGNELFVISKATK